MFADGWVVGEFVVLGSVVVTLGVGLGVVVGCDVAAGVGVGVVVGVGVLVGVVVGCGFCTKVAVMFWLSLIVIVRLESVHV